MNPFNDLTLPIKTPPYYQGMNTNECSSPQVCEIKEQILNTPDHIFNKGSVKENPYYKREVYRLRGSLEKTVSRFGKWYTFILCVKILLYGYGKEK